MAKVFRRKWKSTGALGERVWHTSYGYTFMIHGKRERKFSSAWTREDDARKRSVLGRGR